MNALFVPDQTNWDNTWLGAIGVTVFHDGKKMSTIEFTAADQLVKIRRRRAPIVANTIKKISFHNGKLTLIKTPSNNKARYPRVQVELIDTNLNFTVRFAKNSHLDLHWHRTGEPFKAAKGVVGKFTASCERSC